MTASLAFAFLIGTITTVNPCGFVLLPAYFTYRLGTKADDNNNKREAIFHAITIGLSTTAGFVLIFAVIGGAMMFGANWLTSVFPWTGFIIGVILMMIGICVMVGLQVKVRFPTPKHSSQKNDLGGDFMYGVGYAIVSLSCTLPIFLTITGATFAEGALSNVFNFIAFTFGVGTILIVLSVSAALTRNGLEALLKSFLPYIHRISGALLFLAGLYISYLWGSALFMSDIPDSSILATGERFSAVLKIWLTGSIGQIIMPSILVFLIFISIWSYRQHDMKRK